MYPKLTPDRRGTGNSQLKEGISLRDAEGREVVRVKICDRKHQATPADQALALYRAEVAANAGRAFELLEAVVSHFRENPGDPLHDSAFLEILDCLKPVRAAKAYAEAKLEKVTP
jgi:hypothetical protein